jgi:hypothetical protein
LFPDRAEGVWLLRRDALTGFERGQTSGCDLSPFAEHVVHEELVVVLALVELLRGEHAREDGNANVELHPHQP